MGALTKELGGDADMAEILDGIKLSEDEISSLTHEISKVEANRAELQQAGSDFKTQYANERRITKGMEVLLASQKVRSASSCRTIHIHTLIIIIKMTPELCVMAVCFRPLHRLCTTRNVVRYKLC